MTPILTDDVAARLETALAEASAARLAGVAGRLEVGTRSFEHVIASRVRSNVGHYHYFSGPRGLRAGDAELVGPIVAWFGEAPIYVRLAPMFTDEALLRALADAGLRQTSFMSVIYGATGESAESAGAMDIHEDPHAFAQLWTAEAAERELLLAEFSKGWRCYVARLDQQEVAYGALYVARNGVAVCAAAATRPEFRGRGCQTALLRTRMAVARQAGCDLVVIQASPGSGSQRNMQRLGLQVAWTGVTWSR